MVAVAHRRWSFSRDSNCKALTGKVLMVCLGRRLWEVVAYERWSHCRFDCIYICKKSNKVCTRKVMWNLGSVQGRDTQYILVI